MLSCATESTLVDTFFIDKIFMILNRDIFFPHLVSHGSTGINHDFWRASKFVRGVVCVNVELALMLGTSGVHGVDFQRIIVHVELIQFYVCGYATVISILSFINVSFLLVDPFLQRLKCDIFSGAIFFMVGLFLCTTDYVSSIDPWSVYGSIEYFSWFIWFFIVGST